MSTTGPICCHCRQALFISNGLCHSCGQRVVINGRYQLDAFLGSGGFGSVYSAFDSNGHRYAVKMLPAQNAQQFQSILNEVSLLQNRLKGLAFVPTIYGAFQHEAAVYIVMTLIRGSTLDPADRQFWPIPRVRRFLEEMLGHLHVIHRIDVVHRDIKPQNIIRNSQREYFLIDFGIAKDGPATRTVAHGLASIHYASLEQIRGERTTAQSDLYSLGVTAYELLTGTLPPTVLDRLSGKVVLPPSMLVPGVPQRLEYTIMALLGLYPHERPPSAAVALDLLRDPVPAIQNVAPRPVPPAATKSSDSGGCIVAFVVGLAIVLIAAANGAFANTKPPEPQPMAIVGVPSGRLVFSSNREGNYELYLADAGGGPPWNLSRTLDEQEHAPSWSADGTYIAYVSKVGSAYRIARLDLATLQPTPLTPLIQGINHGTPAVSPDSSLIAYNSGPEDNYDLYVMGSDGGNPRLLAAGPGTDYHPGWFPDGQRLVYVVRDSGGDSLQLVGVDGTPLGTIYRTTDELRTPVISPDGRSIAFAMGKENDWKLYIMPIDGTDPQRVTREAGAESYPAWSSDGSSLMFMSTRDDPATGNAQLFIVDRDGSNLRRVFFDAPDDRQPAWRP